MSQKNLLVELFVEELPPRALENLGTVFSELISAELEKQGLIQPNAKVEWFATPRRLAVRIADVLGKAPEQAVSTRLMPVQVGLDANGNATPALLKRLAGLGADALAVAQLKRVDDGKQEMLFFDSIVAGVELKAGLQAALNYAIDKLPIPKVMGYQLADGWSTVHFVRPVHRVTALWGSEVIGVEAFGLQAGRETQGHRFESKMPVIDITDADAYEALLETQGSVIASYEKRREMIATQLEAAAQQVGAAEGVELHPVADNELLDEVTALVERPNVLICQFEKAFLEVPQECLILTMKSNQRYFPLLDKSGKLTRFFLVVSNITPDDANAVIEGNQKVVRPRLADAKFFYEQDRKSTLESRTPQYANMVYHNRLGTLADRVIRVEKIAEAIATKIGDAALVEKVGQAVRLSKADLVTGMVGEFPELQGIMGHYYALNDGLGEKIAEAIEDHYKPRFSGDELPRNTVGVLAALADKLETVVGMFGIGNLPTGDRDPFALRRHALGVIRLLLEKQLPLELDELLRIAVNAFTAGQNNVDSDFKDASAEVASFIYDRLAGLLHDQGYAAREIQAVLALRPQRLDDVLRRLEAVRAFAQLPEAPALAEANKRVGNILKKTEGDVTPDVDEALLKESAEAVLYQALCKARELSDAAYNAGHYTNALKELAVLKEPVDAFFVQVMVNVDDEVVRRNRLGLLAMLHQAMNRVADLSMLA